MLIKQSAVLLLLLAGTTSAHAQLSLEQAIRRAVMTNPAVGEASANRRATDYELRQSQGGLLPQIRVQADIGPERTRLYDLPAGASNNRREWSTGRQANVVVRQVLFDGFSTTNEIWRQAARVDAASWRVQERSELVALDTVQAYIDILRLRDMIAQSERNISVHRKLLSDVETRFQGGRAGRGDRDQVQERVFAADAARAELQQRLGESVALFRRAVGQEPSTLRWPGRPRGLPVSRAAALDIALNSNPTLRAADADLDAVRAQRQGANASNLPVIALEGRAELGKNTNSGSISSSGRYDDFSGKLTASWLLYSGGADTARQYELAERVTEQSLRFDVLRRQARESIDKAWSTRVAFDERARSLGSQVAAAGRVVDAYRQEYELGQRTLLDLLNAEQSLYNARVALINSRGLAVFADYQMLAATGSLLAAVRVAAPGESKSELRAMRDKGSVTPGFDLLPKAPIESVPVSGN
jgi:adhesin transport system outer membrane protein